MSTLWHVFGVLQSVWVPLFVFSASVPASSPCPSLRPSLCSPCLLSFSVFLSVFLSVFFSVPPLFVFPVLLVASKIPQSHL